MLTATYVVGRRTWSSPLVPFVCAFAEAAWNAACWCSRSAPREQDWLLGSAYFVKAGIPVISASWNSASRMSYWQLGWILRWQGSEYGLSTLNYVEAGRPITIFCGRNTFPVLSLSTHFSKSRAKIQWTRWLALDSFLVLITPFPNGCILGMVGDCRRCASSFKCKVPQLSCTPLMNVLNFLGEEKSPSTTVLFWRTVRTNWLCRAAAGPAVLCSSCFASLAAIWTAVIRGGCHDCRDFSVLNHQSLRWPSSCCMTAPFKLHSLV